MAYIDFLSSVHKKTKRDYLARVNGVPKAQAATVAKKFGKEYWDGDRSFGYGGFSYDGRWQQVAKQLIDHYQLTDQSRILDIGCGKAFLLYDFTQILPNITIRGLDISQYAISHAKPATRPYLDVGQADALPYDDNSFDLALSINTFHNLPCYQLEKALREMERVTKKDGYLVVESYRTEEEKANLLYWQLTCESFYNPKEWQWWFDHCGFTGDHSFIYFE